MDDFNIDLINEELDDELEEEPEKKCVNLFNFDIISNTEAYKKNVNFAETEDLVRDICDDQYSDMPDDELKLLDPKLYIHVVQKSNAWLKLREWSCGTASNIGKYVHNSKFKFSNIREIQNLWLDKLNKKPFEKNHTTEGHMTWGVKYEDLALIHLGIIEKVGIAQVGSIKVNLIDILKLGQHIYKTEWIDLKLETDEKYILVSPDGIVGKPEKKPIYNKMYSELIGMLEIKCISPFYHVATNDNKLIWCSDMNKRQWFSADKIPYVYIIQQALQAISGVLFYGMKSNHYMWFIRWSPCGLSIFKFKFIDLVKLGVLVANLYFSFYQKLHNEEDILKLYPLKGDEALLEKMIENEYINLLKKAEHKYVELDDYPEFMQYYTETKDDIFAVNPTYL
jgi:hypothetical protein